MKKSKIIKQCYEAKEIPRVLIQYKLRKLNNKIQAQL